MLKDSNGGYDTINAAAVSTGVTINLNDGTRSVPSAILPCAEILKKLSVAMVTMC